MYKIMIVLLLFVGCTNAKWKYIDTSQTKTETIIKSNKYKIFYDNGQEIYIKFDELEKYEKRSE